MCKFSVSSVVSEAHHDKEWMPFQSPPVANVTRIFLNDNTKSRTVSSVYSHIHIMNYCEAIALAWYYTRNTLARYALMIIPRAVRIQFMVWRHGVDYWQRWNAFSKHFCCSKGICFGCGLHTVNRAHGTGHTRHVKPVKTWPIWSLTIRRS